LSYGVHLSQGIVVWGADSVWRGPSPDGETLSLPNRPFQVKLTELRGIFPRDVGMVTLIITPHWLDWTMPGKIR
jgi:hypothetical protein